MRVILEPKVYLVGSQAWGGTDLEEYLSSVNGEKWSTDAKSGAEALCEVGGRVCYDSFKNPRPGGNKAYLEHILEVGHGSVLEHAIYSFIFTDISRACTHELVRHRAGWGYSQRSTRYVDETEAGFVLPEDLRKSYEESVENKREITEEDLRGSREIEDGFYDWKCACELSVASYKSLTRYLEGALVEPGKKVDTELRKRIRQTARSVLPQCLCTTIFCTVNARSLRHFFELRASRFADPEIRRLAVKVWEKVVALSPNIFGDYEKVDLGNGTWELQTKWRKV